MTRFLLHKGHVALEDMKKQNTIAIVYDFDGTLTPRPMQEYTVLPQMKIKPEDFWKEVKIENRRVDGEEIITYMMLMLQKADQNKIPITKKDLGSLASKIEFYPGVTKFFGRVNRYVRNRFKGRILIRHYMLSSGLKEIIDHTAIKGEFHKIFASEYAYDHYKAARYPKLVVTDTVKTQFLFRINKGKENLAENINESMPEWDRPIPFTNILYIGDGMTDVPCMTVATKNGGYAIAVYDPTKRKSSRLCRSLFSAARVEFIAPADYRPNKPLEKSIKTVIDSMGQGIIFRQAQREIMSVHIKAIRNAGH